MIDLKQFCSIDPLRPYIHKPFSRGEFTYATNGHVCLRVPRIAEYPEQEKPDPTKLFSRHFNDGPKSQITVSIPPHKTILEECEYCDGRGHEHTCPDCTCECMHCEEGMRDVAPKISVHIGNAIFDAKYIRQLLALPGLRFCADPPEREAAPFVFEGGDGIIMPLSSDFESGKFVTATIGSP